MDDNFDADGEEGRKNLLGLNLYNFNDEGEMKEQIRKQLGEHVEETNADLFMDMNQKKIERIRERMKNKTIAEKSRRAKSAGELALMFMGINKIAYDLLLENPMTGYMNEIIFTRVLGVDEIEHSGRQYWQDCSQCYVCEKWDKIRIDYHDSDSQTMKQNIKKLDQLHQVVKQTVNIQRREREKQRKKQEQDGAAP